MIAELMAQKQRGAGTHAGRLFCLCSSQGAQHASTCASTPFVLGPAPPPAVFWVPRFAVLYDADQDPYSTPDPNISIFHLTLGGRSESLLRNLISLSKGVKALETAGSS